MVTGLHLDCLRIITARTINTMKHKFFLLGVWLSFFSLVACNDDEGITVADIDVPEGYALSAGTSTIFINSSKAYDSEADWVTGSLSTRFNRGDRLYDDVRTSSNGYGGGLGPVYGGLFLRQLPPECRTYQADIVERRRVGQYGLLVDAGIYYPQKRGFLSRLRTSTS